MSHCQAGAGYQPTCVVAGTEPGLGLAIAERYASEGFLSYVLLRRPQRAVPMIHALRARGLDVVSVTCDVSSISSVRRALRTIKMHSGRCDVLIYNSECNTSAAAALALVNGTVQEMRERSNGAMLFSGRSAMLRALVDRVANDVEADGIRVGIVTVDGIMPKQLADLYWEFFATDEHVEERANKSGTCSQD